MHTASWLSSTWVANRCMHGRAANRPGRKRLGLSVKAFLSPVLGRLGAAGERLGVLEHDRVVIRSIQEIHACQPHVQVPL